MAQDIRAHKQDISTRGQDNTRGAVFLFDKQQWYYYGCCPFKYVRSGQSLAAYNLAAHGEERWHTKHMEVSFDRPNSAGHFYCRTTQTA